MEKQLVVKHGISWKEANEALKKAERALGVSRKSHKDCSLLVDAASGFVTQRKSPQSINQTRTISEIIAEMAISKSERLKQSLQENFAKATFGIMVHGIQPGKKHGEIIHTGGGMTMPIVQDPNGNSMLKLCADPVAFLRNFPNSFNCTLTGQEAMEMAQKVPNASGILVCSAVAWASFPIYKHEFQRYLSG